MLGLYYVFFLNNNLIRFFKFYEYFDGIILGYSVVILLAKSNILSP